MGSSCPHHSVTQIKQTKRSACPLAWDGLLSSNRATCLLDSLQCFGMCPSTAIDLLNMRVTSLIGENYLDSLCMFLRAKAEG